MDDLINCINRIPTKLNEIYEKRESAFSSLMDSLSGEREQLELVFVASGSSYNAAFTISQFAREQCGLKMSLTYPNIFVNYTKVLNPKALYLFISQTGHTKLVYDGIEKAQRGGCKNCAIAADADTPIAKKADVFVDMGCGQEEFMYRTLGFSATVATLYMLVIRMALHCGNIDAAAAQGYYADFKQLPESIIRIGDVTQQWYVRNKFSLLRRTTVMLTATNDYWPVAQEADIKLMEMVPMMSRSMELEEFIHGPQNCFNNEMIFFLLSKRGEDEDKVRAIASFLKTEIGFCSVVGECAEDERDLRIVPVSTHFAPLEMITVFQLLAYKMATDKGRDLGRGVNSEIGYYISKTI